MNTTTSLPIGTRVTKNGKTYEVAGHPYFNGATECVTIAAVKDGEVTRRTYGAKVRDLKVAP
jgi:hypothetical protein